MLNPLVLLEAAPPKSDGMDLSLWKWVVIIAGAGIVIFYLVKRISEIVVNKKTEDIIRQHGTDDEKEDK